MAVYILIAALICVADQFTKYLVVQSMQVHDSIPVIEGVLHITRVSNKGMAFGLLADHRWIFICVSVLALAALAVYSFMIKGKNTLLRTALALIIGGGIGNMFDRLILGYVVDFVDVRLFDFWKWIFNVADCAVCIGAALLMISVLSEMRRESAK